MYRTIDSSTLRIRLVHSDLEKATQVRGFPYTRMMHSIFIVMSTGKYASNSIGTFPPYIVTNAHTRDRWHRAFRFSKTNTSYGPSLKWLTDWSWLNIYVIRLVLNDCGPISFSKTGWTIWTALCLLQLMVHSCSSSSYKLTHTQWQIIVFQFHREYINLVIIIHT